MQVELSIRKVNDSQCGHTYLDQKGRNILALVTLELDDLSKLRILHDHAVAAKLLLQVLENLVVVKLLFQSLNSCQTFSSIPLLHTDMHIAASFRANPAILNIRFREWVYNTSPLQKQQLRQTDKP